LGDATASGGHAFNMVRPEPPGLPFDHIERLARQLEERLLEQGKDDEVQLEYDGQGGLRIDLPSRILFGSAEAQLKRDAETQGILTDVAGVLSEVPDAFFEMRGHTDSRPLADTTVFRDNYELSFARAMTVTRFISENGRIPLEQFEVIACGPGQPVATNDTPEGQAANRRVEIYVRGKLTPKERRDVEEKSRSLIRSLTGRGTN
ncbi:MAG: OmpA family protein, partial [FCB group bacterium]|nr:OmpA family protein [FCB group bacterium]